VPLSGHGLVPGSADYDPGFLPYLLTPFEKVVMVCHMI
jgi:hypothetical protein